MEEIENGIEEDNKFND